MKVLIEMIEEMGLLTLVTRSLYSGAIVCGLLWLAIQYA